MDNDSDISNRKDIYDEQQQDAELLEPSENREPGVPMTDGGDDRTNFRDERRSESFDTRYERLRNQYERFRNKYDRLQDKHIETQDELNHELRTQNEMIIDEYGDVIELLDEREERYDELDEEYRQMKKNYENTTDKLIYTLDDYSDSEKSEGIKDAIQGTLFFGAGLLAADQYSFDGAIDFYANAASNYANEPETMILTLGLPLIGAWFFKNAFENWNHSRELDNAATTWRQRKANLDNVEHIEEVDKVETDTTDGVDVIRTDE